MALPPTCDCFILGPGTDADIIGGGTGPNAASGNVDNDDDALVVKCVRQLAAENRVLGEGSLSRSSRWSSGEEGEKEEDVAEGEEAAEEVARNRWRAAGLSGRRQQRKSREAALKAKRGEPKR